jgi:hypothetical protein
LGGIVKKSVLKNSILAVFIAVGVLSVPVSASAEISTVKDECAKELLLSYFPEPIVLDTLKRFNVPQDKWAGIAKSLASKDKDVVKIVEKKASAMNPNPLRDTQQRQVAVKLFRDTLFEVFSDAMKENDIQDQSQFMAMLDDIQQQKAKKFAMCVDKHNAQLQNQAPGATSSSHSDEESDDDDSDDDDEEDDDDKDSDKDSTEQNAHKEEKKLISPADKGSNSK